MALTYLSPNDSVVAEFTFEALDRRIRSVAAWLQASNKLGERVLLLLENNPDFLIAFMGCLYAGAIPVPAYTPRLTHHRKRLLHLAEDCGASLVMTTQALSARMDRYDDLTSVVNASKVTLEEIDEAEGERWVRPDIAPESTAFLQYTSGSMGRPKGVVVSHSNVVHNVDMLTAALGASPDTPIVTWLPLFHDMGLIGTALHAFSSGAHCVLMAPMTFFDKPARWLRAIDNYRAAISGGPSFAYRLCVDKIRDEDLDGVDLSCWKSAFNGAEPVSAEVIKNFTARFRPYGFKEKAFWPCFGMAETTLLVSGPKVAEGPTFRTVDAEALQKHQVRDSEAGRLSRELVGCGRAWHGQSLCIVDPETGVPCEPGVVGEIWVSGPSVAQGYWGRPEQTRLEFHAEIEGQAGRYFRTQDLGFLEGGQLFVTGRLKDLIIVRGRNFYPQDIE
ncbi:MAG: fatty acyl-AMP ligase, partial [Myxococcota bacterium]